MSTPHPIPSSSSIKYSSAPKGLLFKTWSADQLLKPYCINFKSCKISPTVYSFLMDPGPLINPFGNTDSSSFGSTSSFSSRDSSKNESQSILSISSENSGTSISNGSSEIDLEPNQGELNPPNKSILTDSNTLFIESAIKSFGGKGFVKLDSKCPFDSLWLYGTLECYTAEDTLIKLRASDRIRPIISRDSELIMKSYISFQHMLDFRLVFIHSTLKFICSRRNEYYPAFFKDNQLKMRLQSIFRDCAIPFQKYLHKFEIDHAIIDVGLVSHSLSVKLFDISSLEYYSSLVSLDYKTQCLPLIKLSKNDIDSSFLFCFVSDPLQKMQPSSASIAGLPQDLYEFPQILKKTRQEYHRALIRKKRTQNLEKS